jgi:hypothetical protein
MRGLSSFTSWRTFLTGLVLGYIFAWGIHWAVQFWSMGEERWVEENVPFLTPSFGKH